MNSNIASVKSKMKKKHLNTTADVINYPTSSRALYTETVEKVHTGPIQHTTVQLYHTHTGQNGSEPVSNKSLKPERKY